MHHLCTCPPGSCSHPAKCLGGGRYMHLCLCPPGSLLCLMVCPPTPSRCTCPPSMSYPGPSSNRPPRPLSPSDIDYNSPSVMGRPNPLGPAFGGQPSRPGRSGGLLPPPSRNQSRKPKKNHPPTPHSSNARPSNPRPPIPRSLGPPPPTSRSTNLPPTSRSGLPRSYRGPPALEERFSTMSIRGTRHDLPPPPKRKGNAPWDLAPPPAGAPRRAPPAGGRGGGLPTIYGSEY